MKTEWTNDIVLMHMFDENARANLKFAAFPQAGDDAFVRILGEEFGEVCEAINKKKPPEELIDEVIDVMSVCYRFLLGELKDGNI